MVKALPAYYYRDPADSLDRIRAERVSKEKRTAERRVIARNKLIAGLTEDEQDLIPDAWLAK